MIDREHLTQWREVLNREGRLIRLSGDRTAVFVGDTHGDRDATERVLERFPPGEHVIVFLGDYVDRGPDSLGNLTLLLEAKVAHPDRVHLLMGNHEGWAVERFAPADFWDSLPPEGALALAELVALLPLAVHHPAGVLAVHGALPNVATLEDLTRVTLGSEAWRAITWGDWHAGRGGEVGAAFGRPMFGADHFLTVAERLGIRVVVRSHQPRAPRFLFGNRCLTIFTSRAYGDGERLVAVLPPARPVWTAYDLDIVVI